jgi:ADP-heptose:LPS heptosyltransferase
MRTLVINLTRFGDLIQTQPVLSGLKAEGFETGLVCLENFASAAGLLSDVDEVFPLPGARLLAELKKDWRGGLAELNRWKTGGPQRFGSDLTVNLTSHLSSRLLASLAGGSHLRGFCLDSHGFSMHSGHWAAFLQASSRYRGSSPFNLVDLFMRAAQVDASAAELSIRYPDAAEAEKWRGVMLSEAPEGTKGFIGLQLGASARVRTWPASCFAEAAKALWREFSYCPVLLGGADEKALIEEYASSCEGTPFVDLAGRTSLGELSAVVSGVKMLLSNDTGTMHLAAGLGVPVAAIFLATAQPWDTGPYRSGCLCLEPDMDCHPCGFSSDCSNEEACRQAIVPETLLDYVRGYLHDGRWPEKVSGKGARAWLSSFDRNGFMDLRSISGHEVEDRTGWIRLQRHFYRHFLDREGVMPPESAYSLSRSFALRAEAEMEHSLQMLHLLRQQAGMLQSSGLEPIRKKFLGNWQRLTANWTGSKLFSVLGDLWREESQNLSGGESLDSHIARYLNLMSAWLETVKIAGTDIERFTSSNLRSSYTS